MTRPTPSPAQDRAAASGPAKAGGEGSRVARHHGFTGERPGWDADFDYDYARHLAAYRAVAPLVAGRRVLDAGCGEGFGTATLAADAAEVVGVDYNADAVAECRRLWCDAPASPSNLRFAHDDLTSPRFGDDGFNVVLCFQVVEHIQDPRPFLRGLTTRLAPGGTLVLTTPNRLRTVSENPYHVREYTAAELQRELRDQWRNQRDDDDRKQRADEGRRKCGGERLTCLALLRHRMAIECRCDRPRLARNIEQHRRDGAAEQRAPVDAR